MVPISVLHNLRLNETWRGVYVRLYGCSVGPALDITRHSRGGICAPLLSSPILPALKSLGKHVISIVHALINRANLPEALVVEGQSEQNVRIYVGIDVRPFHSQTLAQHTQYKGVKAGQHEGVVAWVGQNE